MYARCDATRIRVKTKSPEQWRRICVMFFHRIMKIAMMSFLFPNVFLSLQSTLSNDRLIEEPTHHIELSTLWTQIFL